MNGNAIPVQALQEGVTRALQFQQEWDEATMKKCQEAREWLRLNRSEHDTPEWIADLNRSVGIDASYLILSGHIFWEEHQLREGLCSLFQFGDWNAHRPVKERPCTCPGLVADLVNDN